MALKIISAIITVAILVGGVWWFGSTDTAGKTNREVADMCIEHTNLALHIHPTLKIVVGGVDQPIPANAGITPSCMHPLHTHDATGTLHIESPDVREFVLGDFFYVWGQTYPANAKLTVNGVEVTTGENTILKDKEALVLTY